jgi:hypothetical protein
MLDQTAGYLNALNSNVPRTGPSFGLNDITAQACNIDSHKKQKRHKRVGKKFNHEEHEVYEEEI